MHLPPRQISLLFGDKSGRHFVPSLTIPLGEYVNPFRQYKLHAARKTIKNLKRQIRELGTEKITS